ncbi:MAG: hypothetical protein R3E66_20170 [bacterium]
MKNTEVVLLVVGVFAAACNAKSPETTERPADEPAVQTSKQEAAPEAPKLEAKPTLAQLPGPYHTALDLLANRPNAHRLEYGDKGATVVVDTLQPDFVRYIHGNHPSDWKLNVTVDEKSGALLNKKRSGKVWVPGYAGASEIQAEVWSGSDNNALTFVVNGVKAEPQKLEKGWQVISVPSDKIGSENTIEFDFSNMSRA